MRTAESYSQGLPSVGRAAQQELRLPRKLIIFNPGRRKEGGEGEGLRKKRGLQRRGEERRGWGRGKERGERREERRRAEERAVEGRGRDGLAGGNGGEWKERPDRWSGGKPAGRGLWEGHGCGGDTATLLSLSLHPSDCFPGSRAPWGSPATPTRGCPSWPCHPELEPCPSGYHQPRAVQGTRLGEWGALRQPQPCLRVTSPCPRGDLWGMGQERCPENLMVPKGQGFWRRGRKAPKVPFLQPWGRARLKTKPSEGP